MESRRETVSVVGIVVIGITIVVDVTDVIGVT